MKFRNVNYFYPVAVCRCHEHFKRLNFTTGSMMIAYMLREEETAKNVKHTDITKCLIL